MNRQVPISFPAGRIPLKVTEMFPILLLALLLRLLTYNGAFGSDDLVYFERAAQLAHGEWSSANYNGALRYGFNLPAAGFMAIFGESLFAANIWPLICSLIEISAVFIFASSVTGRRAGVFAGLLLATAPLHIAVATRIHADPVVSMFITVSFVLLYFGAVRRQPLILVASGLSIGGIFWTKELAAVTWFAFLPMLWFFRGQWRNCLYVVAGAILMMILHGLLMLAIAGDPLHLIKVVLGAVKRNFVNGGQGEDSAAFYLRYLFVDLRHVGALGFFAAASIVLLPPLAKHDNRLRTGFTFALMWWIGLLIILSLFPVSLSPLRLTMKQSNYITLFLAPTALIAGMTIAVVPRTLGVATLLICASVGCLLGAFQQADYLAFTANTKSLAAFAVQHPRSIIVGSVNNSGLGNLWVRLEHPGSPKAVIIDFRELSDAKEITLQQLLESDAIFTVLDRQTMNWFAGKGSVTEVLPCWQHEQSLEPVGLGFGNELAKAGSRALESLPIIASVLDHLSRPQPADIYRVDGGDVFCRVRLDSQNVNLLKATTTD